MTPHRFLLVHAKRENDEDLAAAKVAAEELLRESANGEAFELTLSRDDYRQHFERCGGWEEWTEDVVTGRDFASGQPRYTGYISLGHVLGRASADILHRAIVFARKPVVILAHEDNHWTMTRAGRVIQVSNSWADGFQIEAQTWPQPAVPPPQKDDTIWIAKDGRAIRVCDMGNQHLVNAIQLIERMHIDINCSYFDEEATLCLSPAALRPQYNAMLAEALNRVITTNVEREEYRREYYRRAKALSLLPQMEDILLRQLKASVLVTRWEKQDRKERKQRVVVLIAAKQQRAAKFFDLDFEEKAADALPIKVPHLKPREDHK